MKEFALDLERQYVTSLNEVEIGTNSPKYYNKQGGIKMRYSFSGIITSVCLLILIAAPYGYSQFGSHSVPKAPATPAAPKMATYDTLSLGEIITDGKFSFAIPEFKGIAYVQVGTPDLDQFFKSSAMLDGCDQVAKLMNTNATMNLKKYARSHAADAALKGSIADVTKGAPDSTWTDDQCTQIEKLAKKQGITSKEESEYFLKTSANMAILVVVMNNGIGQAKVLVGKVDNMKKTANGLDKTLVAPATSGVIECASSLAAFVSDTPVLVKSFVTLGTAFSSL